MNKHIVKNNTRAVRKRTPFSLFSMVQIMKPTHPFGNSPFFDEWVLDLKTKNEQKIQRKLNGEYLPHKPVERITRPDARLARSRVGEQGQFK